MTLVALCWILAATFPAVTQASVTIPSGNRTLNPSFETNANGWSSFNGSVSSVADAAAPNGSAVARVTSAASNTQDYTLDDTTPTIPSANVSRSYTARAWVKADTSSLGKRVVLVIRSTAGSASSTCSQSTTRELTASFVELTTVCTPDLSGDALDVYVARRGDVVPGERFEADAISLVDPQIATVPTGNLTSNPSFETDLSGWDGFQSTRTRVADPDAPSGAYAASVASASTSANGYSIGDLPASVPGTAKGAYDYRASAWVRGTAANAGKTVKLAIREVDSTGTTQVQEVSSTVTLSATRYVQVSVTATAQRTGDSISLYVARTGAVNAGETFRVDALTLVASSPAQIPVGNLTSDPSFESGVANWQAFQGSVTQQPSPGNDPPDGARVARVVAGASRTYDSYTLDDAQAAVSSSQLGHTYSARAWAKAGSSGGGSKTAYLNIRETNAAGEEVARGQSDPVTLTADRYTQLTAAFVPKNAGDKIDVFLERRGSVTTGETFYADAITMIDTPVAMAYGSATTLRPDSALPAGGSATAAVAAAKNETASFQVALRSAGVPLVGVRAAMTGPLTGPGGATLPADAVALSREAYYTVDVPTDGEGALGRWPDELIPDRDPLLGGDGGAFPFDLGASDAAAIWADVAVPTTAAAGSYTGTLRVTTSGTALVDVPITLTVRPFTLPSTSSLRSLFVLNPYDVCAVSTDGGGSGGFADIRSSDGRGCDASKEQTWRVFARFAALGLRDRVSIANPYPTVWMRTPSSATSSVSPSPARTGAPTTEAAAFDTYVKPLLDGTATLGTLSGAKLTAFTTGWDCIANDAATTPARNCLADWKSFLDSHDPSAEPRFLPWVCDEPAYDDSAHFTPWRFASDGSPDLLTADSCARLRKLARDGWPGIPVKITTSIDDPGLYGSADATPSPSTLGTAAVNVLAPNLPDLVSPVSGSARPAYDAFAAKPGAEVWSYISCTSGGCDPGRSADDPAISDAAYDGLPSYSIDQPASQASAMGWISFLYGLTGESYFDVASGFNEGPEFQHGIRTFGTNGDGQLFYPGQVKLAGSGGTTTEDMPFESIRLKRIREGREDYEYLQRLSQCGRRTEAVSVGEGLFGDLDHAAMQTTVTQAQLDAARNALANLITQYGC